MHAFLQTIFYEQHEAEVLRKESNWLATAQIKVKNYKREDVFKNQFTKV